MFGYIQTKDKLTLHEKNDKIVFMSYSLGIN